MVVHYYSNLSYDAWLLDGVLSTCFLLFTLYRIQYGWSTGKRPWLTIEDTILEQTGILIGNYVSITTHACTA